MWLLSINLSGLSVSVYPFLLFYLHKSTHTHRVLNISCLCLLQIAILLCLSLKSPTLHQGCLYFHRNQNSHILRRNIVTGVNLDWQYVHLYFEVFLSQNYLERSINIKQWFSDDGKKYQQSSSLFNSMIKTTGEMYANTLIDKRLNVRNCVSK